MAIGNLHRMTPEEVIKAQKEENSYKEPKNDNMDIQSKPKEKKK